MTQFNQAGIAFGLKAFARLCVAVAKKSKKQPLI